MSGDHVTLCTVKLSFCVIQTSLLDHAGRSSVVVGQHNVVLTQLNVSASSPKIVKVCSIPLIYLLLIFKKCFAITRWWHLIEAVWDLLILRRMWVACGSWPWNGSTCDGCVCVCVSRLSISRLWRSFTVPLQ